MEKKIKERKKPFIEHIEDITKVTKAESEVIAEGNKLIIEFIGAKLKPYKKNHSIDKEFTNYEQCKNWIDSQHHLDGFIPELGWGMGLGKYHSSWSWIMPVVEKISEEFDVSISSVGMWACYISRKDSDAEDTIADFGGYDPITNIWMSVVKFLKWYNKQPKYKK